MLTLFTGLVLAFVAQDDAAKDPAKDFKALCQQLIKAESYAFEVVTKDEGGFGGMRMGRGGQGGNQARATEPTKTSGKYQKGQPFLLKSGKLEAYRLEDATVYKEGEAGWKLFDRQSMMRGAGRRGAEGAQGGQRAARGEGGERGERAGRGEGGERGERGGRGEGGEGGERAGRGEGAERGERAARGENRQGAANMTNMRAIMNLGRVALPHETIKKVVDKVKDVKCEEKDGKVIYTCTLTKEGAEALAGTARFGRGRGGAGGPTFERSGTLCFIVTAEGAIEKIKIDTKSSGTFREQKFEQSSATTIGLSELGKVKVEVPEEAITKFEL